MASSDSALRANARQAGQPGMLLGAVDNTAAASESCQRVPLRDEETGAPAPEPVAVVVQPGSKVPCWSTPFAKGCTIASITCVLLLVALILLGRFWVAPSIGQSSVDHATITLDKATMHSPSADSIMLSSEITVNNVGFLSAKASGFRATLGSNGNVFAWCDFPAMDLQANGPTSVSVDTRVYVTDPAGFTRATARILQGHADEWDLSGKTDVTSLGITLNLNMNKKLQLPATLLNQVQASDIEVTGGAADELYISSATSFFSSSVLEMVGLGGMTFAIHPADPSPPYAIVEDVQLGTVALPNFTVLRGYNSLNGSSITMRKTPQSEAHVAQFFSNFMSGVDQYMYIRGPINSTALFLDNITTQLVLVPGLQEGFTASSLMTSPLTLLGHDGQTGSECDLAHPPVAPDVCLRGGIVYAQNVLRQGLKLDNVSFDVSFREELAYNVTLFIPAFHMNNTFQCNKGKQMVRMYSTPGMWWSDSSRGFNDTSIVVPGATDDGGKGILSFFLAGEPQPGQAGPDACAAPADPFDCCFSTIFSAAACRAKAAGSLTYATNLVGNATVTVGNFSIRLSMQQQDVPIAFANDIPNFVVGPLETNCSYIKFWK